MQALKDQDLSELLNRHWGQVRDTRNPDREKVVAEMKTLIRMSQGDPFAGEKVFKRVCAACHKIYGEGPEIGPDITLNGRNDFNQLLSNVFDPSLVIGAGYRVCTVITTSGRVQSGLLVEDSPQRVVLKPAAVGRPADAVNGAVQVAVGKLETIPRDEIDEFKLNELSLMPEGLEKQLSQQEIVDLFAFITLDKHPSDKTAKRLPGVTAVTPRQSTNAAEFPALVAEILPGFTTSASGVDGVALLNNHFGRDSVLRTHPVNRDASCVLTQKLAVPAGKKTKVIVDVAHDPRGDWRLVIRGNGERLADEMISKETCKDGWRTITADLTKFAGSEVKLDLLNQANDWSFEFGYWGSARIVSE
jgi:putative heme-binding domain-containing protein